MLRPGGHGIEVALLVPLLAAVLSAFRDITTRMLAGSDSSTTILFYTQVMGLVIGLPFMSTSTPFPDLFQMGLFAFAGLMMGVAHYLMILSLLLAQGATVAPFRYLSLLWSVLLGWLIWHDLPDIWIITGSILVVASGLFVLRYETRLVRAGARA
jgi:drug/metabolite transporter (DMT)-like permease